MTDKNNDTEKSNIVNGSSCLQIKMKKESNVYELRADKVFYAGQEIKDADAETFKCFGQGKYMIDKNNVYYNGKIVEGADPKTFECINDNIIDYHEYMVKEMNGPVDVFARDKNNVYYNGKFVGKIPTFEYLDDD